MGDAQYNVITVLGVGITPPGWIVDAAAATVITFEMNSRHIFVIQFQINIGRPVHAISGGFCTDFKRKFNLLQRIFG